MLTPTRKKIGKAVARGSKYAIVRECFTDLKTRQFVLNYLGNIICKEIKTMVSLESNSILQSSKLEDFKWDMLLNELNKYAPIFINLLQCLTKTKTKRSNEKAVIGMCASILLKHRFVSQLGSNHDIKVKKWKENLKDHSLLSSNNSSLALPAQLFFFFFWHFSSPSPPKKKKSWAGDARLQ